MVFLENKFLLQNLQTYQLNMLALVIRRDILWGKYRCMNSAFKKIGEYTVSKVFRIGYRAISHMAACQVVIY
jgi:hypothetical protein